MHYQPETCSQQILLATGNKCYKLQDKINNPSTAYKRLEYPEPPHFLHSIRPT